MSEWPHQFMSIEVQDGRWFVMTGAPGRMAHVVPVDAECTDYLAWFDDEPDAWFWMFDPEGNPILNREHLAHAAFMEQPALLFSTPAAWLANGCVGSVLLDTGLYVPGELAGIERVVCDSPTLIAKLESWYRPRMPEIRLASRATSFSTSQAA